MKLIYCNNCADVLSLSYTTKTCRCGETGGHYERDGLHAIYYGNAMPLGFTNDTFKHARERQPEWGNGFEFTAFVIPKVCPTMVHTEYSDYSPVGDPEYNDSYEHLEEEAVGERLRAKLGNAFKTNDDTTI